MDWIGWNWIRVGFVAIWIGLVGIGLVEITFFGRHAACFVAAQRGAKRTRSPKVGDGRDAPSWADELGRRVELRIVELANHGLNVLGRRDGSTSLRYGFGADEPRNGLED